MGPVTVLGLFPSRLSISYPYQNLAHFRFKLCRIWGIGEFPCISRTLTFGTTDWTCAVSVGPTKRTKIKWYSNSIISVNKNDIVHAAILMIENGSHTNARGHLKSRKHMTIRNDVRDRHRFQLFWLKWLCNMSEYIKYERLKILSRKYIQPFTKTFLNRKTL